MACRVCDGAGYIKQQRNGKKVTIGCPACMGKSKSKIAINYNKCPYCGGLGYIRACCGEQSAVCDFCKAKDGNIP